MSDDGEEPERKRQRLEAPEALVMGVDSPARWDFLAPWCEELKGQLVSLSGDFIRVLGPRRKREKLIRFNLTDGDEEEEGKVDPGDEKKEIEQALWRTREAIELLSLVAKVDPRAFHMLMTQQCGLRLDGEDSEEVFVLSDDEDSMDGEEEEDDDDHDEEEGGGGGEEGRNANHRGTGQADQNRTEAATGGESDSDDAGVEVEERDDQNEEEENLDDVFVLPPSERQRERETFISPRFDFIALRGIPGGPEISGSLFADWEKLILAEAPQFQPSAAYKNAKQCILDMLPAERKVQPRIQRSLEIPVSLEFSNWAKSADELADHLKELSAHMEEMHHRAEKLDTSAAQELQDCASTFVYCLTQLSMTLSYTGKTTDLFVDRLLGVLGRGIHVKELRMYLNDEGKDDSNRAVTYEMWAKLLSGMLVRPFSPTQKQIPSFTTLHIDCNDATLWQLEALCSALVVSRVPVKNLTLTRVCHYQINYELRRRYWRLLAQAFFHPRSSKQGPFSSVCGLRLLDAELTLSDLCEINNVLEEKEHQEAGAQQWAICQNKRMLREGTLVQFTEMEGAERVLAAGDPVTLPCETPVDLVESNSDNSKDDAKSEWLDVVIPGYGQCCVSRDSVIAVPNQKFDQTSMPIGGALTSLSLSFSTESCGVRGLIEEIGWSLETLSLTFHRAVNVTGILANILRSCPRMTKFSLCESYIDLDGFSTIYESARSPDGEVAPVIRTLEFHDYHYIGEGEGKLFMKRLGDPSTRLAKDLRELSLLADEYADRLDDPTLSELWVAMGKNTTLEKLEVMVSRTMSAIWKRQLRQFHGQVLPPRPLPLPSKLAFLSGCYPPSGNDVKNTSSAAHHLDQRVLSRIFELAATRVVRSVKVWG